MLVSLGQYVGCRVERCCKLLFLIAFRSSLPFVVLSLDPPNRVFGVKFTSSYKPMSKCLEKIFVLSEFGVMIGGGSKLR